MTAGDLGAPPWAAGTPLLSEMTGGFPLPADVTGAEPSPRRRFVPLIAVAVTLVAAVAVTAIVLGKTSAHHPTAAQAPAPAAARTSAPERAAAARELTIGQLRAGDCLQGPPDINTARSWPDVVAAVPCIKGHLAEVYFSSANYWPMGMAFPGHAAVLHQARAECRKAFHSYDGIPLSGSEFSFIPISPWPRVDWDSGERMLLCTAYEWSKWYPRGQSLYGSIKGSAS